MIRRIFILLISLIPFLANAQTIHWLTFIDTEDSNVGAIDVNGRRILYDHFINLVNAAISEKGYKTNIRDIYGKELTPQKCKEVIANTKCGPDDIIVFYYIGHGTHGTVGGDVWPMMFMGQDNPNYLVPLKWVHDQLKAKGARLTTTIGMCCNVYQGINRRQTPTFAVNYGNTYLTDTEKQAIQDMFLKHKGDFLLSSASPGQSSIGVDTKEFGPMDLFSFILVKIFEDYASEGDIEWTELFTSVKDYIHKATQGEQTPIFVSNLSNVSAPSTPAPANTPVKVTPRAPQTSGSSDLMNLVGVALDNLIDSRQTETARIAQASELEKIFTPNAIVKVMSQDGNIVIDKSPAEDFIGRLTTSRILLKVAPVDIVISGNKISEMKVKEVYKK